MKRRLAGVGATALFIILASAAGGWAQGAAGAGFPVQYQVGQPLVIGDYTNPYRYDGNDVRSILGDGSVQFDPSLDQGLLTVEVQTTDESGPIVIADGVALEGDIKFVMNRFYGPQTFMQGGIAKSLLAYGDTGILSDNMPQVLLDYVGWGWIDVYVNGELVYKDLVGQFMVNDRLRRRVVVDGYTISRSDETIYSPTLDNKTGFVYTMQKELHLFVADKLAGIQSPVNEHVSLHLNLLVVDQPETQATGGGGGSTTGGGGGGDQVTSGGSKGDNGIGNGEDGQPPGNPPVNDGSGSGKGSPGNKK